MKARIERAILKRMKLKDVAVGQLFVLSETSDLVLMKLDVRGGAHNQGVKDAIPESKRLVVGLDSGYIDTMDEDREILPVEGELTGRVMTL